MVLEDKETRVSDLEYGVLYEAEDDEKYRDEKQVEGVDSGDVAGPSVL